MLTRKLVVFTKLIAERRIKINMDKRQQFGNRFLTDPEKVFEHNAWDNVEWNEEQETDAKNKVTANSEQLVESDKQELYERDANRFWDEFYSVHQNRFFKDRHWLFTEFPELLGKGICRTNPDIKRNLGVASEEGPATAFTEKVSLDQTVIQGDHSVEDLSIAPNDIEVLCQGRGDSISSESLKLDHKDMVAELSKVDNKEQICMIAKTSNVDHKEEAVEEMAESFPGRDSTFRIFEVGCGVGNTVYPVLQTNNDQKLFVYCCDLSDTAIQLVKEHADYQSGRCHAFVCDITEDKSPFPFPEESLDLITLIFVLSAIHPEKMQSTINRLARCLKPGGHLLFRDYGRYDLAQLRFKNGRCLSENFYVRGDGTRVYFFTQEELKTMFETAGLVEDQNIVDRRLQVNRGRQLKMYRVWIQCKYRKPVR